MRTVPPKREAKIDPHLPERLERGEVVVYPVCPFVLPDGAELQFLLEQHQGLRFHKNVSYDPLNERASGHRACNKKQRDRLTDLLADFSRVASSWVASELPGYAGGWKLDRVSYRPIEEATRRLRPNARNDLLHVDAFPTRPSQGHRILRLFVNLNPTEPRVWVTTDPFAKLLERFGKEAGLPGTPTSLWNQIRNGLFSLFAPARVPSPYDEFMVRFHHYLKRNDEFQERCFKRYYHFPPMSAWLAMTDAACHAVLRGRYALDHSYFVAPQTLALPDEAPAALLERVSSQPAPLRRAA